MGKPNLIIVLLYNFKQPTKGDITPSASADNPYLDLDYSGYHKNLIQ